MTVVGDLHKTKQTGALNPDEMARLMRVSLGEEKADLVIQGGDLVNVYSAELLPHYSVAVKGKRVACVGPDVTHTIGPETEVIDASGRVLIPGLVDAHAHMLFYLPPHEFLKSVMKGGVTTVVTEIMELSLSLGYGGLVELLDGLREQPIKVFATVPSADTLNEESHNRGPSLEQLIGLLEREEIVGVGENFWQEVIRGGTDLPYLSEAAMRLGKAVEGHAAGCRGEKLAAYLAYGISSCHESVSVEEVVEKLRFGLYVMVRQGSIRKDLAAVSAIKNMNLDLRRLVLVTDGFTPRDLVKTGYIETVVQRAIDLGFDPILAIQMATLNPAEHFGLSGRIGGIAPGRDADILILPDLKVIKPTFVISNGRVVAQEGALKAEPHRVNLPHGGFEQIHVSPSDFLVKAGEQGPLNVRVIDQVTSLVTREAVCEMTPRKGQLHADPEHDFLKVALINSSKNIRTGFIRGLGMKAGAFATSTAWETFGIVVVGASEEDMAQAVNRISQLGGGMVLWARSQIQAELPLPIGGFISEGTVEEIARRLEDIQQKAEGLGFRYPEIPLTVSTLTTPAIPFTRLSDNGIVNTKTGEVLELIVGK